MGGSMNTTGRARSVSTPVDQDFQKFGDTSSGSLDDSLELAVADRATVRIRDGDEAWAYLDQETARFARAAAKGKAPKSTINIGFPTLERLRQFLTPQRQLLYRVLRRRQPGSVYELAKMLGRPYKAVAEDLKVLKEMHLVRFKAEIHNGRARSKPILTHKKLVIEFG